MARKTHFRNPFTSKLTFEILIIIGKVYFKLIEHHNYSCIIHTTSLRYLFWRNELEIQDVYRQFYVNVYTL